MQTYQNTSGHTFTAIPYKPLEIYTDAEIDAFNPGQIVTDTGGAKFTVTEIRHVSARLYRIVMLPLQEQQP